jgi:hypothetical protein
MRWLTVVLVSLILPLSAVWAEKPILIPGNGNGDVALFDLATGKGLLSFQGHVGEMWALAPSPDGRFLLSASNDHTLRLWKLDQEEPLLSLFFAGNEWIAWTPRGYYAASPGGEKLLGWHVNNGPDKMATFWPAAFFHSSFYRPDVIKRLLATGNLDQALEQADKERTKPAPRFEPEQVTPPQVVITAPDQSGTKVKTPDLEVRAVARASGRQPVTTLRLLLDGRPYEGQKGIKQLVVEPAGPPQGEVREKWTVHLEPGKHRLAVQAESAVSKAVSDEVEVSYEQDRSDLPSLYVLAIGISAYPGSLKLDYSAKDAQELGKAWSTSSKALYQKVEVKVLTDARATRKDILAGLTWLKGQMTQKDVAVVSYSGHGAKDNEGTFYLAPVDVDPNDLLATGVPGDQVKKTLAGMPGRIVFLLDACHAGSVGGDKRKALGGLTDELVRDLATDDYGVVVMCASMGREVSFESTNEGNGYFTKALLEGLSGKADFNKDGVIYLSELDTYVTDRVKELSKGQQHPVTAKPTSIRSFPLSKP